MNWVQIKDFGKIWIRGSAGDVINLEKCILKVSKEKIYVQKILFNFIKATRK